MGHAKSVPMSSQSVGPGRFLYAIVTVDDPKYVKFGIATHPERRFSGIQSSCPLELRLEAVVPHAAWLEREIHESLKRYSVRGEWYTGCDEILRAVEIIKGGDVRLLRDYADSLSY